MLENIITHTVRLLKVGWRNSFYSCGTDHQEKSERLAFIKSHSEAEGGNSS